MTRPSESKRSQSSVPGSAPKGVAASPLSQGLWLVATPIGHAGDITLRALDVLRRADVLACEDTRRTRKLLEIHGISLAGRPILAYHDQNGTGQRPVILSHLAAGRSVAYASDAGTPLIADPGYRLVQAAREAEFPVHTVPGASAVLAALTLAGLPTDRFLFGGFLPPKQAARKRALEELADIAATLVFYESPRRLAACLTDMADVLGANRNAAILRELTKLHEETLNGTLGSMAVEWSDRAAPKGEIVLVIGPPSGPRATPEADDVDTMLRTAMEDASVKDAARIVATKTGLKRRDLYQRALGLAADAGKD